MRHEMQHDAVVRLEDERARELPVTGGKGANLSRLIGAGFHVPDGFCVTTDAYRALIDDEQIGSLLGELGGIDRADTERLRDAAGRMRRLIEERELPDGVRDAITELVDDGRSYVVRSSATAEDLPGASFAGQHDTVLDVSGSQEILAAVRRCMASLFTDRAVSYRAVNDIAHADAAMAVVVQRMIDAESSGVLFTADPTSGRRNILAIDAAFGLGEAVVSGTVTADSVQVDRESDAFDLTIGDATEAYGGRLTRALREVVHVRPGIFVLRDDLASDEARTFEYRLHAIEEMTLRPQENEVLIRRPSASLTAPPAVGSCISTSHRF